MLYGRQMMITVSVEEATCHVERVRKEEDENGRGGMSSIMCVGPKVQVSQSILCIPHVCSEVEPFIKRLEIQCWRLLADVASCIICTSYTHDIAQLAITVPRCLANFPHPIHAHFQRHTRPNSSKRNVSGFIRRVFVHLPNPLVAKLKVFPQ